MTEPEKEARLDDPQAEPDRGPLVRALVRGVLRGSLLPMTRKALVAAAMEQCSRTWAEIWPSEILEAALDLEEAGEVGIDLVDRFYGIPRIYGLLESLPHLEAAASAASELAELNAPPVREARSLRL